MKVVRGEHVILGAGDREREIETRSQPRLDQNGWQWQQAEDRLPGSCSVSS